MKNKLLLTLLLFAGLLQAQVQKESYSFTLQEAIDHAVQNNYSVINANRDIEIAKQRKWETTTIGLPQISANGGYQYNFELQKSVVPAEFFGGQEGEFAEVAFGTKQNMNGVLTVNQLIFDGSYLVGLQSAKTYLKISENAKVKTTQEIKEIVVNSYGNVLLAEESIVILNRNKTVLEKTLGDTKEIFKNGLIEEENVEQLQITLASVNSSLENVKRQQKIALNMLKLVLGMDLESDLLLKDKLTDLAQNNVDLQLLSKEFNVTNNIDYQIGQNTEVAQGLLLKLERSQYLPSLSANYNLGYNAFSDEFTFFSQNQKWFNFSYVGLNLNIPIFSSGARNSRMQQAKLELEKSRTDLTQMEQRLKLNFQKAKSDYEYSLEQLTTSKESLRLAERIEGKNQTKFTEGISTSFDLTEAQRQLYTAQQNYLQTMLDVINRRATLEKILN